ncbi:MAG: hypothetical protein CVU79_02210 [Elusimicrobia bacterium HGW-Elusimicrobia-3]|jgi:phosphatidylglycerophosphate synthase|nr:MAG: hypothetical protein CVU79_02210 [Elusimicrobia bacterium HGW-Elusimicrobia-3]
MRYYTVTEMKESLSQKSTWERQFPVTRFIYRPVSFYLASFMSRFTNSPETIVWLGLPVGIAAAWLLLNVGRFGPWPGIAGLALFALLDAVDGNMARATKQVTLYGRMIDGVMGKIAEGIYIPALACGLYLQAQRGGLRGLTGLMRGSPEQASWTVIAAGFTALCAMLYCGAIETAYDHLKLKKDGPSPLDVNAKFGVSRFSANPLYLVFVNINAFNVQIMLLAGAVLLGPGGPVWFIYLLCAYYLVRLVIYFSYYIHKASKELK